MEEAKRRIGNVIEYVKDKEEALIDADALFMVTEWPEFRFPNFNVVKKLIKQPVIFDGRNVYDGEEMMSAGFDYFCIGVDTTRKKN
jgi:UDPglucose 6-dehydrogenase